MTETKDEKQVSHLLCGLSSAQYQTLRDLVAPHVPKDLSFDELTSKLKAHYDPKRNIRMEQAKFCSITREENETILKFEARLRHGVRYCGYTGSTLNDCLVEEFILRKNFWKILLGLLQTFPCRLSLFTRTKD